MSQDKDNNEAASAPDLQSRINAELAKAFKDDPANACRAHAAITAALAASASQSSTPVPRVGGNTSIDTPEFLELVDRYAHESSCEEYNEAEYKAARKALVGYIDSHIAHVARQRQESPKCTTCNGVGMIGGFQGGAAPGYVSEDCPDCTPSAAVAEGVDTAEMVPVIIGGKFYYTAEMMTTYGAQQREAGRREERAKLHPFKPATDAIARQPVSEGLMQALQDITDPIGAMTRVLPEGSMLDGQLAMQMADDPQWYKRRAQEALNAALSAVPPAKAEGISDALHILQEFVDYCAEPAGMTLEIVKDKALLGDFMKANEARGDSLVARARAILAQQAKKGGAA